MADTTLTRRNALALLLTLMAGSAFGATDAEASDDDDDFDDGPQFEHFVVHGVAIGDGDRNHRAVVIAFRPNGDPTLVDIATLDGSMRFTAISDDRATRDLYGAIFGT